MLHLRDRRNNLRPIKKVFLVRLPWIFEEHTLQPRNDGDINKFRRYSSDAGMPDTGGTPLRTVSMYSQGFDFVDASNSNGCRDVIPTVKRVTEMRR